MNQRWLAGRTSSSSFEGSRDPAGPATGPPRRAAGPLTLVREARLRASSPPCMRTARSAWRSDFAVEPTIRSAITALRSGRRTGICTSRRIAAPSQLGALAAAFIEGRRLETLLPLLSLRRYSGCDVTPDAGIVAGVQGG